MTGWELHGIVMGVLVALGFIISAVDHWTPSRGSWISLSGVASLFAWIFIGVYGVASTLTFALIRPFWGAVAAYLAAVPLVAAVWFLRGAFERRSDRRLYERQKGELLSRLELVSWSPETPGPGRLRLRAEIRALRDLLVRFHGMGIDAARQPALLFERQKAVTVKAGETARLELEINVSPDRPMVDHVLEFWSWTDGKEDGASQGVISYEKVDADVQDGVCLLRRPLPPARPSSA